MATAPARTRGEALKEYQAEEDREDPHQDRSRQAGEPPAMPGSMARSAKVDQIRKRLVVFVDIGQVVHVSGPPAMATLAPIAAAPCDGVPLHLPFRALQVRVIFRAPVRKEAPVKGNRTALPVIAPDAAARRFLCRAALAQFAAERRRKPGRSALSGAHG
jgi:hypothetical protein